MARWEVVLVVIRVLVTSLGGGRETETGWGRKGHRKNKKREGRRWEAGGGEGAGHCAGGGMAIGGGKGEG